MYVILNIVYLIVAITIVVLVLIQQGKGADMGASFGAGASASLFGSSGSGNFLTRTTAVFATAFFILSLLIGHMTNERVKQSQTWEHLEAPAVETTTAPATTEVPAATETSEIPN